MTIVNKIRLPIAFDPYVFTSQRLPNYWFYKMYFTLSSSYKPLPLLAIFTITDNCYHYLQPLPLLTVLLLPLSATVSIIFSLLLFKTDTVIYHCYPYLQLLQLLNVNTPIYNRHHYLYLTIIYYCYNYSQLLQLLTVNTLISNRHNYLYLNIIYYCYNYSHLLQLLTVNALI